VARLRLFDVLQDHLFWAFDASGSGGVPVFNPLFGFSRISAPEIGLDVEQFKDGTFLYNRGVAKGGTVSPVLFERAASMFDSDFYTWMIHTLHGNKDFSDGGGGLSAVVGSLFGTAKTPNPRRNLLIVQFNSYNIAKAASNFFNNPIIAATVTGGIVANAALGAAIIGSSGAGGLAAGAGAVAGGSALGIGPFEFATRIPARSWLLHNCLPVRYRAGNDFDASSGAISLMELEVQPEYIEEFSLGVKP